MKNYGKIFKIAMWILLVLSVALLVWGFMAGFESNGGQAVDAMFYWTYFMLGVALLAIVVLGIVLAALNNPKSLIKLAAVLVGLCAVVAVVYLISPGADAVGLTTAQPDHGTLKLTDTVLNLTYLAGGLAILSIVVGEIIATVRNK